MVGGVGEPPRFTAPAWLEDIDEEDWDRAIATIRRAGRAGETIAMVCHEDPDGDALGSMLAFHLVLRRAGYRTVASWGSEPFSVPPQYTFLPGLGTLTPPRDFPSSPAVLICFDTGSRARLGRLADVVDDAETVIVIDHHDSSEPFGDIELVAPRAAATVVLVDELIRRLGGRPDRDIAACLYTGLVTDTGRFQERNVDASAMELGGRLIAEGIEHAEMNRQMFDTHSFGYLKVLARVLDRSTFVPEASLVYSWLEQADLERFGVALEETEGTIDVLRSAEAAEITMILKELEDGSWRVSLRSKGRIDVGAVASVLGGGGHRHMAGFSSSDDREEIVAAVQAALSDEDART